MHIPYTTVKVHLIYKVNVEGLQEVVCNEFLGLGLTGGGGGGGGGGQLFAILEDKEHTICT